MDPTEQLIGEEEGREATVYQDTRGFFTIGIGCLVDAKVKGAGLCDAAIDAQFQHDSLVARHMASVYPHFADMNPVRMNIANGATMAMTACNVTANSYWATISHVGVCYNAAGVLPLVATSGNATIASSAAYTTLNGNAYLQNYGTGSNGSMGQWRVLGPGGGTPVYTQIGTTGTVGTPESFTTAATATSGVTNIAVTNTASSASTLYYLITDANLVSFKTQ